MNKDNFNSTMLIVVLILLLSDFICDLRHEFESAKHNRITDAGMNADMAGDTQKANIKRECRFRVVDYAYNKDINDRDVIIRKQREKAEWQNGFCYAMIGDGFHVEGLDGTTHCVQRADIQFLDTKEFYQDRAIEE